MKKIERGGYMKLTHLQTETNNLAELSTLILNPQQLKSQNHCT